MEGHFLVYVITVSDRCSAGTQEDVSGPLAEKLLQGLSLNKKTIIQRDLVKDDVLEIVKCFNRAFEKNPCLIVTTGGTGFAERDVTPEATLKVIEKNAPAFAQAIVEKGLKKTKFAPLR